jgi:uncharacterized OB-fold protein
MNDPEILPDFGDPITAPFWRAARQKRLVLQQCRDCARHQFYPRPFCLACESSGVEWVTAKGTGIIYSMTVSRLLVLSDMSPPYVVALIQLTEGPRLLSNIIGAPCRIGDAVTVTWRERNDAPPLPVFERSGGAP